jgi:hypothetical protein
MNEENVKKGCNTEELMSKINEAFPVLDKLKNIFSLKIDDTGNHLSIVDNTETEEVELTAYDVIQLNNVFSALSLGFEEVGEEDVQG